MKIDRVDNETGSTPVLCRWFVETEHGWVGAHAKEAIETLIATATAAERERCAKVCDDMSADAKHCAAAIRGTP